MKRKTIRQSSVFVGNFIDDRILYERKLPAPNPAGSNRMTRLSAALTVGKNKTLILSPGSSARIKFQRKVLLPKRITRSNGILIIYAPALSIPYLSSIFEIFSLSLIFIQLIFKFQVKLVLMYCYYPSTIVVGIISKIKGIKLIEDLEDIVTPKKDDWLIQPFLFSVQQSLGLLLMQLSIFMADAVIIPSERFLNRSLRKKQILVVDGCIEVSKLPIKSRVPPVILFSGLLDKEQGIDIFLDFLKIIQDYPDLKSKFSYQICGLVSGDRHLELELKELSVEVKFYGYVDSNTFASILKDTDICLVLQNPAGRYSNHKTPSKGYEYMAAGKLIIVTPIGDYVKIPAENLITLSDYSGLGLFNVLRDLNLSEIETIKSNAKEYARRNWSYEMVALKISKIVGL